MKIYLDNNLGVTNVEQEELTQDTIGYNILKVYIPNAVLTPYDTFTCYYGALLQNGRKVGWFAMEARTSTDADYEANYTLYKAALEQCVVSVEGKVYIGCQVILGNSGNATLIKKNTAVVQFNVRKSVAINNDILVLDTDQTTTDVLESYKNLLENALLTYATKAEVYTKQEVNSALALKADKSDTYTKAEADNTFAPKSTAITHTGNQLQDYSGNNIYPNLADGSITMTKLATEIKNSFSTNFETVSVTWVNGQYCSRADGSISSDTNQAYTSISVTAGDVYHAKGYALANITPYVLKDANNSIVAKGDYYNAWTEYDVDIYITTSGTLYINSGKYSTYGYAEVSKVTSYKPNFLPTIKLIDMSSELQNSFSKVITKYSPTWVNGYYCQRTNGAIVADTNQAYTSISVKKGDIIYAVGYALANITSYVFKDTDGNISATGEYYSVWTNYHITFTATEDGTLYINSGKYITEGYANIKKFTAYQGVYSSEQTIFENSVLKKRIIDEQLKNDFVWSTNHIPCATFTFDDANSDIDLIASMFEEHNVPVCLAIIPSKLNNVCTGLSANKGSYTVGMTVKQVCQKVVELGGEILVHYGSYLSSSSTDQDYYDVYIKAKKDLEDNGFQTNGIITAGGTNYQTQDFAKDTLIARIYYQYADLTASHNTSIEQFYNRRNFLDSGVASIKTLVDNFVAQTGTQPYSRWLNFASHGTNTTSIEDLEEMLEYVISNNITVTTWKNIYETYKSSKLEERIKALE